MCQNGPDTFGLSVSQRTKAYLTLTEPNSVVWHVGEIRLGTSGQPRWTELESPTDKTWCTQTDHERLSQPYDLRAAIMTSAMARSLFGLLHRQKLVLGVEDPDKLVLVTSIQSHRDAEESGRGRDRLVSAVKRLLDQGLIERSDVPW